MIRMAKLEDVQILNQISQECLGYSQPLDVTREILEALLKNPEHTILVYEEKSVLGFIHASLYETLYFPKLYNVLGLAVLPQAQKRGVGKSLLTALEKKAQENKIAGIRINSGILRNNAHQFYRHMGYQEKTDQKRFLKVFDK